MTRRVEHRPRSPWGLSPTPVERKALNAGQKRLQWASLPAEVQEKVLQAGSHKAQLTFGSTSKDARQVAQRVLSRHAHALPALPTPAALAPGTPALPIAPTTLAGWVHAQNTGAETQRVWSAVLDAPASTPLAELQAHARALQAFHAAVAEFEAEQPAFALREKAGELVKCAKAVGPEQHDAVATATHRALVRAVEAATLAGHFVGPQAHDALRNLHGAGGVDSATRRDLLGFSLAAMRAYPHGAVEPQPNAVVTQAMRERRKTLLDALDLAESLGLAESEHGATGEQAMLLHECLQAMFVHNGMIPSPRTGLFARRLCEQAAHGPEQTRAALRQQLDARLARPAPHAQQAQLLTLNNLLGPR